MDPSLPPPPVYVHKANAVEQARLVFEAYRWPGGKPVCPVCNPNRGPGDPRYPIYKQTRNGVAGYYRCTAPHPHPSGESKPLVFTVRTGTIMSRSHIPLDKWLFCMPWLAELRSLHWFPPATLLAENIGVNRKTAASFLRDWASLRFGALREDSANAFLLQMIEDFKKQNKLSSQ
ncbi:hypothetical protein [Orrella marina]|uniref:Uncharacterized protein n=1 Tax=Orrella marina TaxID=2163011 RepID=A0A2R4XLQ8_9BURK|nr:hypothetical protein [Orrella marina]AWB34738.1 hypothetical protein DBV39_14540 [Orrella marina]